jgi:hypothetical protein
VDRTYDIFEKLPDGTLVWCAVVSGHEEGIARLKELALQTKNELHMMHVPTKTLIAQMNVPQS